LYRSKSELLALVSGKVEPEDIAFEIRSRGLNFSPYMAYNGLCEKSKLSPGCQLHFSPDCLHAGPYLLRV